MASQKRVREYARRVAEEAGAQVTGFEYTGGTHQRMILQVGSRQGVYILSGTPGDFRAWKNARADIRRLIRSLK